MNTKIVLFLSIGILTLFLLQGFWMSAGSENELNSRESTRYPEITPISLNARSVYTTDNTIGKISVLGNTVAWEEYFNRGNVTDSDILVYGNGATSHYGIPGVSELRPRVGSRVVWESNGSIASNQGTVLAASGTMSYMSPDIYGSRVAFAYFDGRYKMGYVDIGSSPNFIDVSMDYFYYPVISDKYIAMGNYIHCFANGTTWQILSNGYSIYGIYDDWIIYAGRWNFGKSIFIDAMNMKTGEYQRIASFDTGYDFFDSIDMDRYLVVFSYDYQGYIYNVLSHKLYSISQQEVWHISIGGGKIAWTDYYGHNVMLADEPSIGSFVEVTLKEVDVQHGENYHHLLVVDSSGRMYGYDSDGTVHKEIPGVVEVSLINPTTYRISVVQGESFKYRVIGGHDGKYTLEIKKYGSASRASLEELIVEAKEIPIKVNEVDQYEVNWEKVASNAADAVKLSVDSDGDGNFDTEIFTSSNISPDVKSGSASFGFDLGGMMCIAIALIVVIVVVLAVVLLRKKR